MGGMNSKNWISRSTRYGVHGLLYQSVPIVAFTAIAIDADEEHCREDGMNGYLMKPVTLDQIIHRLKQYAL
jgi:CheY-like chemotaxis protein